MQKKYRQIWELALPYLEKSVRKDFVVHTKGVVQAMEMLLKKEKGDEDMLMISAILHDTGWSKVSKKLQLGWKDKKIKNEAERQHIEFAQETISEILAVAGFGKGEINKIVSIVQSHRFGNPRNVNKRLLIDADNLSDTFKEQFHSDMKEYDNTAAELLEFRKNNRFYTETARDIFFREMKKRKQEIIKS